MASEMLDTVARVEKECELKYAEAEKTAAEINAASVAECGEIARQAALKAAEEAEGVTSAASERASRAVAEFEERARRQCAALREESAGKMDAAADAAAKIITGA